MVLVRRALSGYMLWDELLEEFLKRPWPQRRDVVASQAARIRPVLLAATESDIIWLRASLQDGDAKWLVVDVLREGGSVPPSLLPDLLQAAVAEASPDDNRFFLEPCIATAGRRAVQDQLISMVVSGASSQRSGAAAALYWTGGLPFSIEQLARLFAAFLETADLELRQNLLPHLPLALPRCPEPLVAEARAVLDICRRSSDPYLRGRAEVQAGTSRLLPPLPVRAGA